MVGVRGGLAFAFVVSALVVGACSGESTDVTESAPDSSTPVPTEPPVVQFDPDSSGLVGYAVDSAVADDALKILDSESLRDPSGILTVAAADSWIPGPLIPENAEVAVQSETWERFGRVAAVVVVVTPGAADGPDEFVAWLVDTADGWRLSHTELIETAL